MKLVDLEHFNSTDLSVAAQMERVKAAAPQIFVAWGTGTPEGTLLRGVADAGSTFRSTRPRRTPTYAQMRAYANYHAEAAALPGLSVYRARPEPARLDPRRGERVLRDV